MEENELFLKKKPESYSSPTASPPPPPAHSLKVLKKKQRNLIFADTLHIARREFYIPDQSKKLPVSNL
jgi:hypothetical protein